MDTDCRRLRSFGKEKRWHYEEKGSGRRAIRLKGIATVARLNSVAARYPPRTAPRLINKVKHSHPHKLRVVCAHDKIHRFTFLKNARL